MKKNIGLVLKIGIVQKKNKKARLDQMKCSLNQINRQRNAGAVTRTEGKQVVRECEGGACL